jgi:hypothetical protein
VFSDGPEGRLTRGCCCGFSLSRHFSIVITSLITLMPKFSRASLFAAYEQLSSQIGYHAEFQDLMYKWELDDLAERTSGGVRPRLQAAFRWLKDHPDSRHNDQFHIDLFVEEALRRGGSDALLRSIERDGFIIDENGVLRRALPEVIDLPAADDEVHILLDRHRFATTKGHLDQAIRAHSEGNWAAANSQFRTFLESLFDEIALLVDPTNAPATGIGNARRQLLANLPAPFLSRDLNEWSDDGKNFVNGTFRRLHPQGSHPGLSDEEDSTFRLHLVLLTARFFLRRLRQSGL